MPISMPASSSFQAISRIGNRRPRPGASRAGLLTLLAMVPVLALSPLPAARALPFDPIPSSFQRWLNGGSLGASPLPVVFDQLGPCTDNSRPTSPYRSPSFSCTGGVVALRQMPSHRCNLDRLTYGPTDMKLRILVSSSCPWAEAIPRSIPLQNRVPLPSGAGN